MRSATRMDQTHAVVFPLVVAVHYGEHLVCERDHGTQVIRTATYAHRR
jgi:hypothetical protein